MPKQRFDYTKPVVKVGDVIDMSEYDDIWFRRRLHRFINYQINLLKGDRSLDDIFELYDGCMLRSSDEDINHLIRMMEDGVFERHQFKDASDGLSSNDYSNWYSSVVNNSYFYTVPVKTVLSVSDFNKLYYTGEINDLFKDHSAEEINHENFSGYSIYQIIRSLNNIDPFMLFNLVFSDVKIEKINGIDHVTGVMKLPDGFSKKVAANFGDKNLYVIDEKGKLHEFMNMYGFLFRYYKKPMFDVFNSVNSVIDGFICPGEGIIPCNTVSEICDGVRDITSSKVYQKVKKDNIKSFLH